MKYAIYILVFVLAISLVNAMSCSWDRPVCTNINVTWYNVTQAYNDTTLTAKINTVNTTGNIAGLGFYTQAQIVSLLSNYYNKTAADARYLQSYTETDPVYTAGIANYYTKVQSDARYLQSYTETDPEWSSDKNNYYTESEVNTLISSVNKTTYVNTTNNITTYINTTNNITTYINNTYNITNNITNTFYAKAGNNYLYDNNTHIFFNDTLNNQTILTKASVYNDSLAIQIQAQRIDTLNISKLETTDQRYNETTLINTKLNITDQRYNETALFSEYYNKTASDARYLQSYTETDPKFMAENSTIYATIGTKLNTTDQRYNDTTTINIVDARVTSVNTTSVSALSLATTANTTANGKASPGTSSDCSSGIKNFTTSATGTIITNCATPEGDITGVTAGTGLIGGGSEGVLTIGFNTSYRVPLANDSEYLDGQHGSYYATDARVTAVNSTAMAALPASDQRYNDTVAINLKLNITDQRYNDTTAINTKLNITDQRYNESAAVALKLDITDQRYNDTAAIITKLNITDQRYNETTYIQSYAQQKGAESSGVLNWSLLQNYPTSCDTGTAVTTIGDTLTCTAFGDATSASVTAVNSKADSINASLQNEILARESLGNWTLDKPNYATITQLNTKVDINGTTIYNQNSNSGTGNTQANWIFNQNTYTGNGLLVTTSTGSGTTGNMLLITATNSAWDRPLVRITDNSTDGGAANVRIDSPNPDIELVETDQTEPSGSYEIAVNSDMLQLNSRNAANSAYETFAIFRQKSDIGSTIPLATLIYNSSSNVSALRITNQAASAGANSIIEFTNEAGNITTSQIRSSAGASYTSSALSFYVANSSKVPTERMTMYANGTVNVVGTISEAGQTLNSKYNDTTAISTQASRIDNLNTTKLSTTGGTMTGNISMGANCITFIGGGSICP